MDPGISTVESYSDRQIIAMGHGGFQISVLLAANQGELVAGTLLGKNTVTNKYEKYTAAVAASLVTGVAANNNAILFTAKQAGADGNNIKVQLKDPAGNNQALLVSISGDTVIISLATGADGTITSTAADVIAAVNAHLIAKNLIAAANSGASTGAAAVAAVDAAALTGGANANVAPVIVLAEYVANQAGDVNVKAYLGGAFYTNMLVGLDAQAKALLNVREVSDITVIPV